MRLAVRRVPFAVRGADTQAEAAGYADACVVVVEIREHRLDLVADAVVIGDQRVPVDFGCRQARLGQAGDDCRLGQRSEEHTSELQSLMRISYAVFCLKK